MALSRKTLLVGYPPARHGQNADRIVVLERPYLWTRHTAGCSTDARYIKKSYGEARRCPGWAVGKEA